ncbi:MAG: hypothetical protein JKX78_03785 [Alteromonadaceae bacterium]|nr:hypothetical protein [Alteromonadaceae bacterium]MBL4909074.1 hypothetical protein [Alteromonadaceae bacterium]MBL4909140.1 hypothetical protein [Alteromonadaceae bacterium]
MGRVLTNNTSLAVAIEASLGVLPGTPEWDLLEPNSIGAFGATITTVARSPISRNRQRRKGTITDLDSVVDFDADLIVSHFDVFAEGFVFANFLGEVDRAPSAVTATQYTVDSGTTLPVGSLVRGVNFGVPGNNGLHLVNGVPTPTAITAAGLATEATPPTNARVEVVGVEGTTGDITITNSGGVITLGSTALDFTTLPMQVGEFIFLGGTALANRFFASPSLDNSGYARIVSIAASAVVLDKVTETFVTDSGTGKLIQIFFGRFLKNVPTDDANFLERSYQFELEYPGLATNGVDSKFSYAAGNFANTMAISMPLADKAGVSFAFIGTDTLPPTETRKAEAENAVEPPRTAAYNTTTDCARLRITKVDETGLTTDFKSLTVTLNNNVSPEKVLCNLGAKFMNFGNFEVNIEAQLVFTDSAVIDAVRNNETVAMDFAVKNDDGAIMFDIPAMTLGGGDTEFPVNESVLINITSEAFQDPTTGNSIGISVFPFVPTL